MVNRRTFVRLSSAAAAATFAHQARSAEPLEALPADNPQAQALKYTGDVSASPSAGYPQGSGQQCTNCLHFTALGGDWGSCALFPGFKVRAAGWCAGWVKKQ